MTTKIVTVEVLKCQNCANRLEAILNGVEGVNAKVDLSSRTAHVEIERDIENDELKNIVEFGGFTVVDIN